MRRMTVEIESAASSHITPLSISDEFAMQIALSLAGIPVMVAAASVPSSIEIKRRRRP